MEISMTKGINEEEENGYQLCVVRNSQLKIITKMGIFLFVFVFNKRIKFYENLLFGDALPLFFPFL